MAFKLKVYASKDFLIKLMEFDSFTIQNFKESNEIDIESYLFFKTILYEKATRIHINLSDDLIENFKAINPTTNHDSLNADINKLIYTKRDKAFVNDKGLIDRIKTISETINQEELPHYLFLGDVSENICRNIESQYGVSCFSTLHLKVSAIYKRPDLEILRDTKGSLYKKLKSLDYNSIVIEDRYFLSNSFGKDNQDRSSFINEIIEGNKKGHTQLNIEVRTSITTDRNRQFSIIDFENWTSHFLKKVPEWCSLKTNKNARHDRYIFTNKHIVVLGNSFFKNDHTHFTSFPIGLYFNQFEDKLMSE